jgi:hypothetical protein
VKYQMFTAMFDIGNKMAVHEPVVFAAPHLIPDDEEDEDISHEITADSAQTIFKPMTTTKQSEQPVYQSDLTIQQTREENLSDFLTEVPTQPTLNVIEDDEGCLVEESNQADLLCWHYCLGCIFLKDKAPGFANNPTSETCCHQATQMCWLPLWLHTRRPWHTKSAQNKGRLRTGQVPGECISVDQLESPLPGFVAQLKGKQLLFLLIIKVTCPMFIYKKVLHKFLAGYEADFNQNNKCLGWEMLFRAEQQKAVATEQFGRRKHLSTSDQSLNT